MSTTHTLTVTKRPIEADKLGYFRFGALADGILITNDCGQWQHVDETTFRALLAGELDASHEAYAGLAEKGIVRSALNLDGLAESMRARKRFVGIGPRRHVVHLSDAHGSLSVETAKDVIDHVMLSTSRELDFEFVAGGAPVDGDLLKFLVQYTTEKNRYEGKTLTYTLVAAPSAITDAQGTWLVEKRFGLRTTLSHTAEQAEAIARLHALAAAKGRDDWRVRVDAAVGSAQLGGAKALVDAVIKLGVRDLRVLPTTDGDDAVEPAAYRAFYRELLEALIAASAEGHTLREGTTLSLLHRMLRTEAAPEVGPRSPSAQGMGQMVYDTVGHLFPSEAARLLHVEREDDMFLLGTVGVTSYKENVTHPTVRALALASLTEGLPGFHQHWSAPFLGLDPVGTFAATGDLFSKLPTSTQVGVQIAMLETLFGVFLSGDTARVEALESWLK